MEAKTLSKKKTTINKGKIKKTIKNVLCRPDPIFWPVVSEDDVNLINTSLSRYKVTITEFKKPHWKILKDIPKENRIKSPSIKKVDGLIFGISECLSNLQKDECVGIIIDSNVNPRTIVQPVIEACIAADLPVVCTSNLRKISLEYFGITTSCLGIKFGCLLELKDEVIKIARKYSPPVRKNNSLEAMEVENSIPKKITHELLNTESNAECPYLYRSSKKDRIFVPSEEATSKLTTSFIGQDFIEFSDKPKDNKSKAYMNMILKRVTNNPNRVKSK